jgi:membrane-bound lytic murein transglycosylase C
MTTFKRKSAITRFIAVSSLTLSALTMGSLSVYTSSAEATSDFEKFKQQFMTQSQPDNSMQSEFEQYQKAQQDEFKAYVKAYKEAFADYKKELSKVWGDDVVISDKTTWVTHSDDLTTRNEVDFEKEEIRVTVIVDDSTPEKEIKEKLQNELNKLAGTSVDTAQKQDPISQKVEKIIAKQPVKPALPPKPEPDTKPVIKLTKTPVTSPKAQDDIAKLVKTAKVVIKPAPKPTASKPKANKKPVNKQRVVMTVPMPKVAKSSKAERFKQPAKNYGDKWKIDDALILAIMHSESSFNPMARSHIPAYGLMQIVPRSAGQDASALIYGNAKMLSSNYLYTPNKNINVGSAYLHILDKRYLRKIKDPESRLYCVIAAYNTGAGNVAKAFTGKTSVTKAAPKINSMTPYQVYNHLLRNLPYDETKGYLKKVTARYEAYKKGTI